MSTKRKILVICDVYDVCDFVNNGDCPHAHPHIFDDITHSSCDCDCPGFDLSHGIESSGICSSLKLRKSKLKKLKKIEKNKS